jgi:predicted dehydrogenase
MDEALKIGIIGLGQIAQIVHMPYLHGLKQYRITALSDISGKLLEYAGYMYGVAESQRYADYLEMIEKADIDAVLVCNKDHYTPVKAAAEAGKHIFVEKPYGFNEIEASEMTRVAADNGVVVFVGYMKRYDPGFEYALRRIKALRDISLVRVHNFSGDFSRLNSIYDLRRRDDVSLDILNTGKARERAAILEELGEGRENLVPAYFNFIYGIVHNTVLLRHLFGNEWKVLYANVFNGSDMSVIMEFGGVRISLEIGFSDTMEIWDENISVYSPKCNISINFPFPYLKNAPTVVNINENELETGANLRKSVVNSYQEAYRVEWLHFYDCVINGREPLTGGADAVLDMKMAGDIMGVVGL